MYAKAREEKERFEKQLQKERLEEEAQNTKRSKYQSSSKYSNLTENLNRRDGGIIEAEILKKPEDIREDPRYVGQTEILIAYVPVKAIDEATLVTEDVIREWIIYGISEEDPYSQTYFDQIQKLTILIGEIETRLKKIPKIAFTDDNGNPLSDDKAREEREKLFEKYGNERVIAENNLEDIENELKAHVAWRRKMDILLVQGAMDENTGTCTWHCKLGGTNDAQEIEDLLLLKQNWSGIRLACKHTLVTEEIEDINNNNSSKNQVIKEMPPWAGRGLVPDGHNAILPDYRDYEVNMLGVLLKRVPSGVGLFQGLDRKSSSLYNDTFSVYYGEYEQGLRHGHGIAIDDTGIYCGSFEHGQRVGRGRLDCADGTTIVGSFGLTPLHNPLQSSKFINPYLQDGEPNGECEVFFADGAYFKGNFHQGVVTGQGDYQSAFNEIQSGRFNHGLLHSAYDSNNPCFHQLPSEDIYYGRFVNGELHGQGMYINHSEGDTYEGYFQHGMKHGRGVSSFNQAGTYRGYFVNGFKHGKGALELGVFRKGKKEAMRQKHDKPTADQAAEKQQQQKEQQQRSSEANPAPNSNNTNSKQHKYFSGAKSATAEISMLQSLHGTPHEHEPLVDEETLAQHELSPYEYMFQGYFMANGAMNQGCVMHTVVQVPRIISRIDKRKIFPLTQVMKREQRVLRRSDRTLDKYADMELFLRKEICNKKRLVYQQQKHYTKRTMYNLDVFEEFNERELKQRMMAREERVMKKQTLEKHPYKKALLPRLRGLNQSMVTAYSSAYESIKPDQHELRPEEYVPDELIKLMLSNFEEGRERQRLLKYDLLWQRAEDTYLDKQKEGR